MIAIICYHDPLLESCLFVQPNSVVHHLNHCYCSARCPSGVFPFKRIQYVAGENEANFLPLTQNGTHQSESFRNFVAKMPNKAKSHGEAPFHFRTKKPINWIEIFHILHCLPMPFITLTYSVNTRPWRVLFSSSFFPLSEFSFLMQALRDRREPSNERTFPTAIPLTTNAERKNNSITLMKSAAELSVCTSEFLKSCKSFEGNVCGYSRISRFN